MDSPTRFFFIRHGEVEASYHRVFGGRIDMESAFDVEYASVTILDWLPQKAVVQLLNFTPWRDLK